MKVGTSLLLLLAVAVTNAQYNYQPQKEDDGYDYQKPAPPTPRGVYLPPSTTKNPYESERDVAAEGSQPEAEHEPGMPFDFTYAVKDDYGNDFSHAAESNGDVVKGEYKTLLPDGRTQIVKYTADWKNGYNAEVTYEGEAVYPEEPAPTRPPTRPPTQPPTRPPTTPKRNPYETDEQIDSQGLYPSTTRAPYVPPPTTTRAPYVPPPTTYRTTTQRYIPPQTFRTTTQRPYVPPPTYRTTTQPPYVPPPTYRTTTLPPYRPPPTVRTTTRAPYVPPPPPRTTQPPVEPPGLYGAPSVPYGIRNNPKFGYSNK